jgi:hypothetical protein
MAGEGHIADMITRMKNNQALKLQRKEQQRKLNELYRNDHHHHEDSPLRDVEISEENLEQIKSDIESASIRERKLRLIETSVFTVIVVVALIFIVAYIL